MFCSIFLFKLQKKDKKIILKLNFLLISSEETMFRLPGYIFHYYAFLKKGIRKTW